ncbi:hypothetical protein StoSoilB22_29030 [Arthrobacter sp. StoSoilB22]|nr:hypothetical protein StoSoilB22_29030 [Arthrobacter sp. StoSoilB22]
MVIQVRRVQSQYGVVYHRRAAQATPKLANGHAGRNAGREAQHYMVETAGGETFRRRDYI